MFSSWEAFLEGLGTLVGTALGAGSIRLSESIPTTRPMDKLHTARRMKGDMAELYNLYMKLRGHDVGVEEECNDLCWRVIEQLKLDIPGFDKSPIVNDVWELCRNLLKGEGYFPVPVIDFTSRLTLGKIWEHINTIRRQLGLFESPSTVQKIEEVLRLFIINLFYGEDGRRSLDERVLGGEGEATIFTVPLYGLHAGVAGSIEAVGYILGTKCIPNGEPFPRFNEKYGGNFLLASGIDPDHWQENHKLPVPPRKSTNKSPQELVQAYFDGTPFVGFFNTSVPFDIPEDARFEHMHLVGGSGHGKTQTLQSLFLSDLAKVRKGERSVIVIDSQGDMIDKMLSLAAVGECSDRFVLIYPKDLKNPPALNLFDFGLERLQRYDEVQQTMLINGTIALYEYVFGALLGAALTQRQKVIFRYLARLLMVVPDATVHTLMDFMLEPESVKPFLSKLDDMITRRFFETQFFDKSFNDTRQQILTRLWGILADPALARMFGSKRNKINMFDSMNQGSIILISTAKDLLKQEGCEILGRFFIALIAQATQERASIPEGRRTPTFVYIDEAHDYFDESIETLLTQARKYNVGLVLAHQFLGQFDRSLHDAVNANTAIKMVGGLSRDDARDFAGEMGCDQEFLQSMRKGDGYTQFACTVKNYTPRPVRLTIPLGMMDDQPIISPYKFKELIELNRERYCTDSTGDQDPPEPDNPGGDDSPLGDPELL